VRKSRSHKNNTRATKYAATCLDHRHKRAGCDERGIGNEALGKVVMRIIALTLARLLQVALPDRPHGSQVNSARVPDASTPLFFALRTVFNSLVLPAGAHT